MNCSVLLYGGEAEPMEEGFKSALVFTCFPHFFYCATLGDNELIQASFWGGYYCRQNGLKSWNCPGFGQNFHKQPGGDTAKWAAPTRSNKQGTRYQVPSCWVLGGGEVNHGSGAHGNPAVRVALCIPLFCIFCQYCCCYCLLHLLFC